MPDKKETLKQLNENLNILKLREAKFAGQAPLALLNQIKDHQKAIDLTRQVITGELDEAAWREAMKPLLLAMNEGQVVKIEAETYIAGDQIITHIYEAPPPPLPPAEAQDRRNLAILLDKVKTFWIEGVLEKSVHNMALIDLGKETQAEAVAHAWEQILELPDQSRQTLPPDKKISRIFDEMNRALLILGAPGSGKTITLLQLARDLIAQAEQDETFSQPVPVVFNLSTWTKGQSLVDWLVEELSVKYQIPKRIGRPWLQNNRILPLLDGLDEVRDEDRTACVEAINHFGQEYGLSGLVVCSRTEEYTRLPVRLTLNGAIRLQPLTLEQVYDYLEATGSKLDVLREALQADKGLQELAKSPLILGIMSLAYQDVSVDTLTHKSLSTAEVRRQHLFDTYIERMFKRKGVLTKQYTNEQTKGWLSWLARGMEQHNQSIFLIERLQPSWLVGGTWFWVYMLLSRAIFGWVAGVTIAVTDWSIGGFGFVDSPFVGLGDRLVYWPSIGFISGLALGFVNGLGIKQFGRNLVSDATSFDLRPLLIYTLIGGLMIGLPVGLAFGLNYGLFFGLGNGLLFGLIGGLFFGFRASRQSLTNDIQTVEALNWSWGKAIRLVPFGILFGVILELGYLFIGIVVGVDEQLFYEAFGEPMLGLNIFWSVGLITGLSNVIFGGLMAIAFGGLYSNIVETKIAANQGIWLSSRNAVFIGLGFGLIFALVMGLLFTLFGGSSLGLTISIATVLYVGIIAALWYGGLDVIQHYTLRLILWYKGYAPRHYAHFLDYAAERVFLQKVGGGYIFIHRLLLEHFAAMDEMEIKNEEEVGLP